VKRIICVHNQEAFELAGKRKWVICVHNQEAFELVGKVKMGYLCLQPRSI
jgi:hypothetical protein